MITDPCKNNFVRPEQLSQQLNNSWERIVQFKQKTLT